MTRINTNVSSLTAQKTLARTNSQLQQALTRLSTGLRINSGKDDPAGLIASEALRSDISSVQKAITNSERANQIIATAESALGQVAGLLNDIRGLVTEAANTGALSDDQIAANQLQVDSSLEALNRIAQTTNFQGRRILDGSFDFNITAGTGYTTVNDLEIQQANLGTTGSVSIDVDITAAAAKAEITNASGSYTAASTVLDFGAGYSLHSESTDAEIDIAIDSTSSVTDVETTYADLGGGAASASFNSGNGMLTITLDNDAAGGPAADGSTVAAVAAAINGLSLTGVEAYAVDGSADFALSGDNTAASGRNTGVEDSTLTVTARTDGPDYNNVTVEFTAVNGQGATPSASYDSDSRTITIEIDDGAASETALADIESAIEGLVDGASAQMFDVDVSSGTNSEGRTTINGGSSYSDASVTGDTSYSGGGVLLDDLVLEVAGLKGTEVFTFEQGALISDLVSAINLVSDATGVEASQSDGELTLNSVEYGSDAFASVKVISEGSSGTFESGLSGTREIGSDVTATVNGYTALGDGNKLSITTSTLAMSVTVDDGSDTNVAFTIDGGGALFQIGPDVVSNQQVRLGIQSVNSASLGGASGRLYQLGSGQDAALAADPTTAAAIIEEVITEVASLRGRLGAFQRTTLETNIASLTDTMENLTAAESSIRDADFAAETAALTRSQVLVQSGISVLSIANQNPQNILALLR